MWNRHNGWKNDDISIASEQVPRARAPETGEVALVRFIGSIHAEARTATLRVIYLLPLKYLILMNDGLKITTNTRGVTASNRMQLFKISWRVFLYIATRVVFQPCELQYHLPTLLYKNTTVYLATSDR